MKKNKKTNKRKILLSMFLVVVGLSIINIISSATLSSKGEKLRELELQARELRHENQLLEQKIVGQRSLTKLEAKAKNYGFVEKPKMIMLSEDASVAHVFDSRHL
ncbi:hypothetical protein ACFL1M_04380 [Patescibacteria group bacterium]